MDDYRNRYEDNHYLIIYGIASTLIILIVITIFMYFLGFNPFLM